MECRSTRSLSLTLLVAVPGACREIRPVGELHQEELHPVACYLIAQHRERQEWSAAVRLVPVRPVVDSWLAEQANGKGYPTVPSMRLGGRLRRRSDRVGWQAISYIGPNASSAVWIWTIRMVMEGGVNARSSRLPQPVRIGRELAVAFYVLPFRLE